MSCNETTTEESGWTTENLQKLLAEMKSSIPECDRMSAYQGVLKAVDWGKVAFPPFSPEACKEKWGAILHKMRKTRSLVELIIEAEDVISDPVKNCKVHPELPKKPSTPNAIFYEENVARFQERHPDVTGRKVFKALHKKYKKLQDEEKAQYVNKHLLAKKEYKRKMLQFRKQYQWMMPCTGTSDDDEHCEETEDLPPKPPHNGYNLFCKDQMAHMEGVQRNSFVSVWAERWRDLTDGQKAEYSMRCRELKRQYTIKLKTFDTKTQQRILTMHGIKSPPKAPVYYKHKAVKKVFPGEPKMPPRSGNAIFHKKQMGALKEEIPNSKDRFIKISHLWQNLAETEKIKYRKEVFENFQKYSKELKKWFKTLKPAEQRQYRTCNYSKCKYLGDMVQLKAEAVELSVCRPSDSEDEDMDSSSSSDDDEEEEDYLNHEQDEEMYEGHDITFEMF